MESGMEALQGCGPADEKGDRLPTSGVGILVRLGCAYELYALNNTRYRLSLAARARSTRFLPGQNCFIPLGKPTRSTIHWWMADAISWRICALWSDGQASHICEGKGIGQTVRWRVRDPWPRAVPVHGEVS